MLLDSTLLDPESDRRALRCLKCERHLAVAQEFYGRVNLRCSRCKSDTLFARTDATAVEIIRSQGQHQEPESTGHRCAKCFSTMLVAPFFSGVIERKCGRCKNLNRLAGHRHATVVKRNSLSYGRPQWRPETLIPLLEARWEQFVKEKRRAQAEVAVGLRFNVFMRDDFRCRYCGRSVDEGLILHADHVIPASKGGPTTLENLVTACLECNLGKSNKLLPAG